VWNAKPSLRLSAILAALEEHGGKLRFEQLVHGLREQAQPVLEMPRLDAGQLDVRRDRLALVAAAGVHHRRPEIAHGLEVRRPILADGGEENGAERLVPPDTRIEGRDQALDLVVRGVLREGLSLHRPQIWFRACCGKVTACRTYNPVPLS
jgi:hypothetical protein